MAAQKTPHHTKKHNTQHRKHRIKTTLPIQPDPSLPGNKRQRQNQQQQNNILEHKQKRTGRNGEDTGVYSN